MHEPGKTPSNSTTAYMHSSWHVETISHGLPPDFWTKWRWMSPSFLAHSWGKRDGESANTQPMRLNLLPLKKTAWFHESCEYLFLPKQISPQKTKPSVLNIIIWATKLPCICHFHQSSLMIRKAAGKVRGAAIDVRGLGTIGEGLVWSASLN